VSGQMTVEEIGRRYAVSVKEFDAWSRDYAVRGLVGLQAKSFLARRYSRETGAGRGLPPGGEFPNLKGRGGDSVHLANHRALFPVARSTQQKSRQPFEVTRIPGVFARCGTAGTGSGSSLRSRCAIGAPTEYSDHPIRKPPMRKSLTRTAAMAMRPKRKTTA
jgi:hypothetical protein